MPAFFSERQTREVIGFGAILYGASAAATAGWGAPPVVAAFAVGVVGLILFAAVELYHAKVPLLDLRLFRKPVFLTSSLLGYVSVIALFGAEFLMPLYLQTLRGLSALQTGLILLPLAITGGIAVTIAGRLYDRLGPRPLVAVGFGILMVNTWQLSQIRGDTSLAWIMFLLALRGIALGATVQTTLVTALSQVPLKDVARGSSLSNATRNLVQSVGVAVLATILISTVSPEIQQLQQTLAHAPRPVTAPVQPAGVCAPARVAMVPHGRAASVPAFAAPDSGTDSASPQPPSPGALLAQACRENIAGFERAYAFTFLASCVAFVLGLMLPGWPRRWAGRRAADAPTAPH